MSTSLDSGDILTESETWSSIYILKQIIMATLKPKKTKIEDTVVGAYQKIEDTVVDTYQKIEDAVVGTYQKIEDKFVEKFLADK